MHSTEHWGCAAVALLAGVFLVMVPTLRAQQSSPVPPPVVPPATGLPAVSSPSVPAVQPRFVVLLDPAHGGSETGARLNDRLLEKDVVLTLSVRLRSALNSRGIQVVGTRESDVLLAPLNRAEVANHAGAAACIIIHATATGTGVHLFTSSLARTASARFLPWQTAQSGSVAQSLRLSSEINSAMAHAEIPVALGETSLQPLDSFACPAVAVEVAPLLAVNGSEPVALSDPAYQKRIVDALAAALLQWRDDWRQQP
jgi:N-acetylmuramoyl-L-alanine amidase